MQSLKSPQKPLPLSSPSSSLILGGINIPNPTPLDDAFDKEHDYRKGNANVNGNGNNRYEDGAINKNVKEKDGRILPHKSEIFGFK